MALEQAHEQRSDASDGVTGKAQDAVGQAKEQVQQKAEEAKGQATQKVREQLETRSSQAGEQVRTIGEAFRKAATHLDEEGNSGAAKAAHQAADVTDRLSGYLTGSSSDQILGDIERFGRQRPWAAGVVGATIGFVGARFLKASSENRYQTSQRARYDADLPIARDTAATAALPPAYVPPAGSR